MSSGFPWRDVEDDYFFDDRFGIVEMPSISARPPRGGGVAYPREGLGDSSRSISPAAAMIPACRFAA